MNDERRMLECAAKAAGYEPCRMNDDGDALLLRGVQEKWNPLTNDGDAFRLASELKLSIQFNGEDDTVPNAVNIYCSNGIHRSGAIYVDVCSDLRRAITQTAARLGGYEG